MNLNKMDCHAVTDTGRLLTENDDQFLIADLVKAVQIQSTSLSYDDHSKVSGHSHGKILLVADGMGGHDAGRRASTLAVDETINYMVNRMLWSAFGHLAGHDDQRLLFADLITALKFCQRRIHDEAQWNADKQGMGTTLTVAIVNWPALHVVHVGDSRCYIDHQHQLQQITQDQTRTQAHVDVGSMTESLGRQSDAAGTHRNVVGGTSPQLDPKVYNANLSINDTLLLCTDGLNKHVPDDVIADTLHKRHTAREVCEELIDKANAAGGSDNITVAVARFHDTALLHMEKKEEMSHEVEAEEQGGGRAANLKIVPSNISEAVLHPGKVLPR